MTAPWWQREALAFDTESTGLNVRTERVVQIALVTVGDGKPRREGYLIDPGVEIPAEATAIHGITTEHAKANGCDPADALDTAAGAIALALSRGVPVIGQNIVYDLSLFHMDCRRHGIQTVSSRLGGHDKVRPIVDTLVLDKHVDKWRKGSRQLPDLCSFYGVKHHGAHDSGYDALASALVAEQIVRRYQAIAGRSLDALHADQIEWNAEQVADLQAHKRRTTGNPDYIVEPGWPFYDCVIAADPTP